MVQILVRRTFLSVYHGNILLSTQNSFPVSDRFRESLSKEWPDSPRYEHLEEETPAIVFGKVAPCEADKRFAAAVST